MAATDSDPADFPAKLDARWDYDKPDVSETRFREELANYPTGAPQALEIATQIARAQGLQGRFDDAHATLDAVEARLAGMPAHLRVRYLLERGRALNSSGAPDKAVPLFAEALDLAQCNDDAFYAIDAAHMLGIAAAPEQRLEWNLKAIAMSERSGDARAKRWLASLDNNIGWTYMDQGRPELALEYFRKALPEWEARGPVANVRWARWAIARALRATGELAEAERTQRALLAEHEREGSIDGYVFEELAELAYAKGDAAAARDWFARAYAALKDDRSLQGEPQRLRRMAELGGIAPGAAAR